MSLIYRQEQLLAVPGRVSVGRLDEGILERGSKYIRGKRGKLQGRGWTDNSGAEGGWKFPINRTPDCCYTVIRLVLTLACNTPADTSLCCCAAFVIWTIN